MRWSASDQIKPEDCPQKGYSSKRSMWVMSDEGRFCGAIRALEELLVPVMMFVPLPLSLLMALVDVDVDVSVPMGGGVSADVGVGVIVDVAVGVSVDSKKERGRPSRRQLSCLSYVEGTGGSRVWRRSISAGCTGRSVTEGPLSA